MKNNIDNFLNNFIDNLYFSEKHMLSIEIQRNRKGIVLAYKIYHVKYWKCNDCSNIANMKIYNPNQNNNNIYKYKNNNNNNIFLSIYINICC